MILSVFSYALPNELPDELNTVIADLCQTKGKRRCLEKAYTLLSGKYSGKKPSIMVYLKWLFTTDLMTIWKWRGYLQCTSLNYLLRLLLVKSGKFRERDFEHHWTRVKIYYPHQYLTVRLGKGRMHLDPWGWTRGLKIGMFANRQNTLLLR